MNSAGQALESAISFTPHSAKKKTDVGLKKTSEWVPLGVQHLSPRLYMLQEYS